LRRVLVLFTVAACSGGGSPQDGGADAADGSSDAASDAPADVTGDASDGGMRPPPMPVISWNVPAFGTNTENGNPPTNANDGTQQHTWIASPYPAQLVYDLSSR